MKPNAIDRRIPTRSGAFQPLAPIAVLALGVGGLAVAAACMGPAGWRAPWAWDAIVLELRAPRVVLGAIVGASLAIAGVALQTLLHNDLAEPYVLGLSGGASAGAVASIATGMLVPGVGAAAGAVVAAALVRGIARGPFDPTRLLLAGVALGAIGSSVTGLVIAAAPPERLLRASTFWLFGGLGSPRWRALLVPAGVLGVAGAWMLARAERLDRLGLGADTASALGVDVPRLRRGVMLAVVALTATTVALAGMIGFVGLIAPHIARRWAGASIRACLPAAALGGAGIVVAADLVARTAIAPREVPVGLVTALVGGPFFLWQLQRRTA
jgi:iron complex transport system permease protein